MLGGAHHLKHIRSSLVACLRFSSFGHGNSDSNDKLIEQYARIEPQRMHLNAALEFGCEVNPTKLIQSAKFVRKELPVRLARSIRSFQTLPYIVCINPHVNYVYNKFCDAFQVFSSVEPITNLEQEKEFTYTLTRVFQDTSEVVTRLSAGIKEIRQLPASLGINYHYLDLFIDNFLLQRTSRRVLAEYHMGLHTHRPNWIGVFHMQTCPKDIITRVMPIAQETCLTLFGVYPPYEVVGDVDATFPYVPVHLEYILLELFKNALRAVVERHPRTRLPPVIVRICGGSNMTIMIQDMGGGIDVDAMKSIWSYGYTTFEPHGAGSAWLDFTKAQQASNMTANQFAGYGFGLPTCRVYSRYLGGDVDIVTMPGYGTDVYVQLKPVDKQDLQEKLFFC